MAEESSDDGGDGAGKSIGGVDRDSDPRKIISKIPTYKACNGCLYYSSLLKAHARNPVCFGISRTLKQVPGYVVEEVEIEAKEGENGYVVGEVQMEAAKEGHKLLNFKYACIGYSVFLINKDKAGDKQDNQAVLPFCAGLEALSDRRTSTADHVPAHVHNKEDGTVRSQPQATKPAYPRGDEFYNRFKRNTGIVAAGVAKNMNRVGNYIKQNLDNILYPYGRRPK